MRKSKDQNSNVLIIQQPALHGVYWLIYDRYISKLGIKPAVDSLKPLSRLLSQHPMSAINYSAGEVLAKRLRGQVAEGRGRGRVARTTNEQDGNSQLEAGRLQLLLVIPVCVLRHGTVPTQLSVETVFFPLLDNVGLD